MSKNLTASAVSEQSPQDQVIEVFALSIAAGAYADMHTNYTMTAIYQTALAKSIVLLCDIYNSDLRTFNNIVESLQYMSVEDFRNGHVIATREGVRYDELENVVEKIAYKTAGMSNDMPQTAESYQNAPEAVSDNLKILAQLQIVKAPMHFKDQVTGEVRIVACNDITTAHILAVGTCADSLVGEGRGEYTRKAIERLTGTKATFATFKDQEAAEEMVLKVNQVIDWAQKELDECAPSAAVAASEAVSAEVDFAEGGEAVAAPEADMSLAGADVATAE